MTDDAADGRYTGTEIYLPMIESLLGTATTVHRGGQAEITVGGDTASGIWAMDDRIWFPGGATLIGSGWYEETYRRTADGWLIAAMRLRRHRARVGHYLRCCRALFSHLERGRGLLRRRLP